MPNVHRQTRRSETATAGVRLVSALWLGFAPIATILGTAGCGESPSQRDVWQTVLEDRSLGEPERLSKLAELMFDLNSCVVGPGPDQRGHRVELTVRAGAEDVVRQVMKDRPADQLPLALKEFHFKSLNNQLADYIRRAKDLHLEEVQLTLQARDAQGGGDDSSSAVLYQCSLPKNRFSDFLAVANLRARESIPKLEKIWTVTVDEF